MATGFGSHHVWLQWGVEMGEKEALRRLPEETSGGEKWEQVEFQKGNWERLAVGSGGR